MRIAFVVVVLLACSSLAVEQFGRHRHQLKSALPQRDIASLIRFLESL